MSDPKLAEALNPRLALQKRMEAEKQAAPILPDQRPAPSQPQFTKQWTPEERAKQNAALAKLLAGR